MTTPGQIDPNAVDPTSSSSVVDPSLAGTGDGTTTDVSAATAPVKTPIDVSAARLDYRAEYQSPMTKLQLDTNTQFRVIAVRREGNIDITPICETIEWTEEGPAMQMAAVGPDASGTPPTFSGSIGLRQPLPWQENELPKAAQLMAVPGVTDMDELLREGVSVNLECYWGGEWTPVWQMRIEHPNDALQDGTWAFDLVDGLAALNRGSDDFHYGTSSSRPKGWLAHEIVIDLARRYQFPVGKIVKGTVYQTISSSQTSVLQVITDAYTNESKHTNKQYVIRWQLDDIISRPRKRGQPPTRREEGRLNVLPLQRNNVLYELADEIQTGNITSQQPGTQATVMTANATLKGSGGTRRKLTWTEVSQEGVQMYGYVHQTVNIPHPVNSMADLRNKARAQLAQRMRTYRQVEITHEGIPFVRRGDAALLTLPDYGFKGKYAVCFVDRMQHTLTGGGYTMDLNLTFIDPLDPYQIKGNREAQARQQKRTKRKALRKAA